MPIPALFSNPDYSPLVCKPVFEDYNLSLTGQRFYFIFIHCRKHSSLAYHTLYPMLKWWSDTLHQMAASSWPSLPGPGSGSSHTLSLENLSTNLGTGIKTVWDNHADQAGSYCQSYPCSQIIREECFVKKKKKKGARHQSRHLDEAAIRDYEAPRGGRWAETPDNFPVLTKSSFTSCCWVLEGSFIFIQCIPFDLL